MPYYPPEVIVEIRKIDLLTYLQACEPYEIVRLGNGTYTTRTHDSLKISNGKWMWWSRGFGGDNALDYLVDVKGMEFIDAVHLLVKSGIPRSIKKVETQEQQFEKPLLLPKKSIASNVITAYLILRGIDTEIINYCIENKLIFESLPYHNIVFMGYDEEGKAKYASYRATNGSRIMGDCSGSSKEYSFRISNSDSTELHLFESAIDLLSYATIAKQKGYDWKELNLVSLSGVYAPAKNIYESKVPAAIRKYLETHDNTTKIILHFDNDYTGRAMSKALKILLSPKYEIINMPPLYGKDYNDYLCILNSKSKNKTGRSYER